MKAIWFTAVLNLVSATSFASNYPADYCNAFVRICKDGPGVVAKVSSGCNSQSYVIGYKKQGALGANSTVDAVVSFRFGDNKSVERNFRIGRDWHNLGFMTSGTYIWDITPKVDMGPLTAISVAFSDSRGTWDSKGGANYYYPVGDYNSASCYSVKTNEEYRSDIPNAAWNVINEAMSN